MPQALADSIHAKGVLAYFKHVLGVAGAQNRVPAKLIKQADALTNADDLELLLEQLKKNGEDWGIILEDGPALRAGAEAQLVAPKRRKSQFALYSVLLNLLLIAVIAGLWLLRPTVFGASGTKGQEPEFIAAKVDLNLMYASFCTVTTSEGTSSEKVGSALKNLFPDAKLVESRDYATDRNAFLRSRIDAAVAKLKGSDELKKLLTCLYEVNHVRFRGLNRDEPDQGLGSVIEKGGFFTIPDKNQDRYGSLLQANGLEQVKLAASLNPNDLSLIGGLHALTAEHASLKYAIAFAADRPAFILPVDPDAASHEKMRKVVLGTSAVPVFVPRPVVESFEAVDPSSGIGGGSSQYILALDQTYYWRLFGPDDRKGLDPATYANRPAAKWTEFAPKKAVTWEAISASKKNGRNVIVASFDIAVVVNDRAIVFRNQSILSGEKREEVLDQARTYLDKSLRAKIPDIQDAVRLSEKVDPKTGRKTFTGTLLYTFLSEQLRAVNECEDLQIMTRGDFEGLMTKEGK